MQDMLTFVDISATFGRRVSLGGSESHTGNTLLLHHVNPRVNTFLMSLDGVRGKPCGIHKYSSIPNTRRNNKKPQETGVRIKVAQWNSTVSTKSVNQ